MSSQSLSRKSLWWLIALAAVVVAFVLRLHELGLRTITHPEVYVPGIPLPEGHSVPPPRLTLRDALWMHYHDEPHPLGWYLAMFGWVQLAGISEWALRFPSVVFAAGSVWLTYLFGRRAQGPQVAALAAVLLALHGFHLFWSQQARMYTAGAFFGLLSSYLLVRFVYGGPAGRRLVGAGYVASVFAGIECVEHMWPVIGLQLLWAVLVLPARVPFRWGDVLRLRFAGAHPGIQLQAVAIMLSAPELLHSVYRMRQGAAEEPSLTFIREYFSLGFLFATDDMAIPTLQVSTAVMLALLVLTLALLVLALRAPAETPEPAEDIADLPRWLPVIVAVATSAFMVWLALIALRRNAPLLVIAAGPILALALPALTRAVDAGLRRWPGLTRWRERVPGPQLLVWLLALVGPLLLFAMSVKVSLLVERGFLIFLPSLLILVAGGALSIFRSCVAKGVAAALLLGIFASSLPYSFARPGSPRDYKALVAEMRPEMQPGDLVFVLDERWEEAPFLYHLPQADYVFADYAGALAAHPAARVWLVTWPWEEMPVINDERRAALAGYDRTLALTALRASAELFVPKATN